MAKIKVITYTCQHCGKRQQLFDASEPVRCNVCKSNTCVACVRKGGVCPRCEPFLTKKEKNELDEYIGQISALRKHNVLLVALLCIGIPIGLLSIPFMNYERSFIAGIGVLIAGIVMTSIALGIMIPYSRKDKKVSNQLEETSKKIANGIIQRKNKVDPSQLNAIPNFCKKCGGKVTVSFDETSNQLSWYCQNCT